MMLYTPGEPMVQLRARTGGIFQISSFHWEQQFLSFGLGFCAVVGIKISKKNIEIKTINLAHLLLFS